MLALIAVLVLTGGMNISYAGPSMLEKPHISDEGGLLLTGKVVETMNSGGYTYVNIEQNGKSQWAAIPTTKITVGQEISVMSGSIMNNFPSKTLGRTFESIVFSPGLAGAAASAKTSPVVPAKNIEKIKVEKADGANAYTVAELHAKRGELDTKSIVLKGQVIKVSMGIMGKNWIHIQDGSGSASDRNNDIIVTSQDVPEVGAVVTAEGILYKDKDFGSGYKYSVIVEEASIK